MSTEGGCQCGAIRYTVNKPLPRAYACHCLACKKQSASAFAMAIFTTLEDIAVTGSPNHFETRSDSGNQKYCYFCGECGTRLWNGDDNPPHNITLKVGTLDDPSDIAPAGHLWASRLQPGILLDPEAAQHQTQPENLNKWRSELGMIE